jgi:hypothetical protein
VNTGQTAFGWSQRELSINAALRQSHTLTRYGITTPVSWPALGDPCPSGDGSSVVSTGYFFAYPNTLVAHFGGQSVVVAPLLH